MFYDKTSLLNRYSSVEAGSFGNPTPNKIDKQIELLSTTSWVERTAAEAEVRGEPAAPWPDSLGAGMNHEENISWLEAAAELILQLRPDAARRARLERELEARLVRASTVRPLK